MRSVSPFTPARTRAPARFESIGACRAASGRSVVATWDETIDGIRRTVVSRSSDDGATWSTAKPLSTPGHTATHPLAVATRTGYVVFWTERAGEGPLRWKTALVD
jgi:hypothetical protein